MKIIKKPLSMQKIALRHVKNGDEIGLVPTMGALHDGHASLFKKAVKDNDVAVASIFVNPTQFGPNEDYLKYPKPIQKDLDICRKNCIDYVFLPSANDMFPVSHKTYVEVETLQDNLCGAFRKNHFKGVATVVSKLFGISHADRAYFGMKDFQQLRIIERMTKDLNFKTKIISCPIIRESSGLAISSRNSYLSDAERNLSINIHKILKAAARDFKNKDLGYVKKIAFGRFKEIPGTKVDYVEIVNFKDLSPAAENAVKVIFAVALWVGGTRLIDNILMTKAAKSVLFQ
jgi:pantoate--beta-alanine ligase